MLISIGDVQHICAYAVLWCQHVFPRLCVHMFTCAVFTLGRLACSGCIKLPCARHRFFYLLFVRVAWSFRCMWDFSILPCDNVCAHWASSGRLNINPLRTPVDTPSAMWGCLELTGDNTQVTNMYILKSYKRPSSLNEITNWLRLVHTWVNFIPYLVSFM